MESGPSDWSSQKLWVIQFFASRAVLTMSSNPFGDMLALQQLAQQQERQRQMQLLAAANPQLPATEIAAGGIVGANEAYLQPATAVAPSRMLVQPNNAAVEAVLRLQLAQQLVNAMQPQPQLQYRVRILPPTSSVVAPVARPHPAAQQVARVCTPPTTAPRRPAKAEAQKGPLRDTLAGIGNQVRDSTTRYVDILKLSDIDHFLASNQLMVSRGGVPEPFPYKVHKMLDEDPTILSWCPHGRAFYLHDADRFVNEILPKHCRQTRWSSFRRQLNLYGFRRVPGHGSDASAYFHELFLRDHRNLCHFMQRVGVNPRKPAPGVTTYAVPDFSTIPVPRKVNPPVVAAVVVR